MMWPCRGGYCLDEEPQSATYGGLRGPVTPDRRKAGLEVSPVDGMTLSDGEVGENTHSAAQLARLACVSLRRPRRFITGCWASLYETLVAPDPLQRSMGTITGLTGAPIGRS